MHMVIGIKMYTSIASKCHHHRAKRGRGKRKIGETGMGITERRERAKGVGGGKRVRESGGERLYNYFKAQ